MKNYEKTVNGRSSMKHLIEEVRAEAEHSMILVDFLYEKARYYFMERTAVRICRTVEHKAVQCLPARYGQSRYFIKSEDVLAALEELIAG